MRGLDQYAFKIMFFLGVLQEIIPESLQGPHPVQGQHGSHGSALGPSVTASSAPAAAAASNGVYPNMLPPESSSKSQESQGEPA